MSRRVLSWRWLPPLVIGIATAMCAEVGALLLLYSGPGMLRSLTIVLVVESAALGLGLWSVPGRHGSLVDTLRRRWLLYLASIVAATIFTGAWSLIDHLGRTRLEQGLGLALLAGLPLYACGALLGTMSVHEASDPRRGPARVGAPAAAGGVIGFAATGLLITHVPTPASLVLTGLALVSVGGLVHGAIMDAPGAPTEATPGVPFGHEQVPAQDSDPPADER